VTVAPVTTGQPIADPPSGPIWLLRDSWTEATRHLRALPRNPELLVFACLQPIMFVVLFVYVFGGSISVPGYTNNKQFVIPGIFAQTVLFGSIYTGLGIAEDLSKGFIDRLRSLPMYSSAMLLGRTMSDVVRPATDGPSPVERVEAAARHALSTSPKSRVHVRSVPSGEERRHRAATTTRAHDEGPRRGASAGRLR
jgi:hypothetical protein